MGFRDYYRQFEDIDEPELNRERRARRERERRLALEQLPELDLPGGDALAQRLRRHGVIVAPGGPLGADDHVRSAILNEPAGSRVRERDA
jgi:hypothetical protein